MKKFVAAAVLALTMISSIQAGPFGLFRRTGGGNNNNNQTVYYDNGELFSAQGVANRMARLLRMGHMGSNGRLGRRGLCQHPPSSNPELLLLRKASTSGLWCCTRCKRDVVRLLQI
jgi:hypothetical protein